MRFYQQCIATVLLHALAQGTLATEDPGGNAPDPNSAPAAASLVDAGVQDPNDPAVAAAADPNDPGELPPTVAEISTDALDPNAPAESAEDAAPGAGEVAAGESRSTPTPASAADDVMDMAAVIALVQQQQAQLAEQQETLEKQSRQLEVLREELDALRAPPITEEPKEEVGLVVEESEPIDIKMEGDQVAEAEPVEKTNTEKRQETSESVAVAQADDPTKQILTDFPGAWRLPGTNAALAIGGHVKSTVVYNWDPLEINDRFIVGSIPVDSSVASNVEAESSISADQSRLNFDLREPTDVGILRAFIEADFAEENETFRLRHAFGQWNRVLAGKTWSAFVDTQATPEEVDFEGLNGRINVRQPQVRVTPRIGETFEFQFSMEDPNPEIQNGSGVTRAPDIVMSGRFQPYDKLHTKVALLGRQIRAQRDTEFGGGVEKTYGWGLTVSGRYSTPGLGTKDSVLFQLNAGEGIGRYINDLSSVGNYDGIFNPETGKLQLFEVLAGYISFQHWWGGTMRSNFTLGAVSINNPGFVEGDAYKETVRASANFMWTPTPRIDLGLEFLWGQRENEDGANGDAKQFQAGARYRF
jgi:hypothetical protein